MENYKEKYEQALERAKFLKENTDSVNAKDVSRCFEIIFPELKESEDERIRKSIIDLVEKQMPKSENKKWMISWLEKQGEQKSIWSEENNCYYDDICEILINLINSPKSNVNKDAVQKDLNWLMSVKESQSKPTWNEEDEDSVDIAIRIIQNRGDDCAGILDSNKALKWLKSLKQKLNESMNMSIKY